VRRREGIAGEEDGKKNTRGRRVLSREKRRRGKRKIDPTPAQML